jgi:hypothetical protein
MKQPLVIDSKIFIISLIIVGGTALVGIIFVPFVVGGMYLYINRLSKRNKMKESYKVE